jgi:hypothetical protein
MSFIPSGEVKKQDKQDAKNKPSTSAKPITQDDDYCAELDGRKMDFEKLRGNEYLVAVSTGPRNKPKLLASTIRGPFAFAEMVEVVGSMYENEQHHAKVYLLEKSFDKSVFFLDEGTIDYIEANWQDILFEESFEAAVFDDEDVITAGTIGQDYNEENKSDNGE